MYHQVVIIGAGPVGGRLATELASRGISTLMVEEHAEIGRPFQCAGLVNPSAMNMVNLQETILQNVDGALIHSPSGIMVPVGKDGVTRTHVVCRKRFDQGVVAQAMVAGAHLWLLSKPIEANVTTSGVELKIEREGELLDVKCDLLIGADGAHSWTRRHFRLGRPKEMMIGFQTDVSGLTGKDNWLEMYTGEDVAPGLFAWVIPTGNNSHRIGVWSRAQDLDGRSVEQCYDALINHPLWKERFAGVKEIARYCGPVPCGVIPKPFKDRVMVIGDAAGMAKPTTGGGIGPGFRQVEAIIDNLVKAIVKGRLKSGDLATVCKPFKIFRKEQDRARALRDLLVTAPDDQKLDSHFKMFNRPDILELINNEGDIEHPVPLGLTLLRKVPEFRKLAVKAGFKILFA
ncbi:MAG: geranylgeranyl reductase family protein [Candidatus Poseidoniales archaeon]|jgi:digeranylgeranylglycerophospholipid reductase|tara:strand:+ start:4270 stop:5472 length:1203 start_codon:yes stop_codon:yes gene_type:complete